MLEEHRNRGKEYFAAGSYQKAIEEFSAAIECDGSDHVTYSNRSGAYAITEKYQEALNDAEKCISLKPDWAKGYSRKGYALFKLNDMKAAIEAYKKGLEVEPGNATIKQQLEQIQNHITSESDRTSKHFNDSLMSVLQNPKLAKYLKEDPSILEKVSSALLGDSQSSVDPKVKEVLEAIYKFDSNGVKSSNCADQTGSGASTPSTSHSTQSNPLNTAEALKQKGNELYKARKFEEALKVYDEAIELNKEDLLIRNNKAAVYIETGEYEKCIEECDKCLEMRYEVKADFTAVAKIYNRLAVCYKKMGQYDEALKMYEKSLMEDNNRHTRAALKDLQREKEQKDKAAYYDPELAEKHKAVGNEFYKKKDYPAAKKEYDEAIKRNPKDAKLYSNRAACLTNLLEYPTALKDVEKALELDPEFVKCWSRKGTIHYYMKEYTKAMESYQKGLKYDPENKECQIGLEKVYKEVIAAQQSGKIDEEQIKHAMADPEIQAILSDPQFRLILDRISENPAEMQKALREPKIAQGLQKLITAGILRVA